MFELDSGWEYDFGINGTSNYSSPAQDMPIEYQSGQLDHLNIDQCVSAYTSIFQTSYRNTILVANDRREAQQPFGFSRLASIIQGASDPPLSGCAETSHNRSTGVWTNTTVHLFDESHQVCGSFKSDLWNSYLGPWP